jgi:hypothetical protein
VVTLPSNQALPPTALPVLCAFIVFDPLVDHDIIDPSVIGSQIFSLPGTKRILVHLISEQQLNLNLNSTYAIHKYHEKTLALAGDRHLWFNTHFQPSGCFS